MSAQTLADRVLALLPEDGSRVVLGALVDRANEQRIRTREFYAALDLLCAGKRVTFQERGGYHFAWREVGPAPDFPLRPRPHRPAPRLRRRAEVST